jgi:hypothetical protein
VNLNCSAFELAYYIATQHAICAWLKKPWISSDNFVCSQVFGIDYDNETPESEMELVKKIPLVRNYGTVIYTTQSHTDDAPRCRVLFAVEEPITSPEQHRRYARGLVHLLGGDRATVNPTRTYHGAGVGGRTELLGGSIDLTTLEYLAEEYEVIQLDRASHDFAGDPPDVQEVADLLARIDPTKIDYDAWWRCIAAVHSLYPDETGIRLVENWTPHKPGEIRQKFRSFGDRTKIGIGSLYHYVREYEKENGKRGQEKAG